MRAGHASVETKRNKHAASRSARHSETKPAHYQLHHPPHGISRALGRRALGRGGAAAMVGRRSSRYMHGYSTAARAPMPPKRGLRRTASAPLLPGLDARVLSSVAVGARVHMSWCQPALKPGGRGSAGYSVAPSAKVPKTPASPSRSMR